MTLVRVEVSGSHLDVGRAYGEAAGEQIAAAIDFYDEVMKEGIRAIGMRTRPYIEVARRIVPHLVEEMEGIAEGAQRSFDEIAVLNCLEEVYDFEACTSVASGRFLLHAEQWYAGHTGVAIVVGGPDDGPPFVSPTCAGFLPVVGMNSCGIAQGVDSLTTTDDRIGVPRVLVSRHVLGATSLSRARRATALRDRAGGYAYVFATADERMTVEATATASVIVDDAPVHTNHCLAEDTETLSRPPSRGSIARFVRAVELTQRPLATLNDCIEFLSDHVGDPQTICNHGDAPTDTATVFGMVCDLVNGTVHVSDGPPCEGRWLAFRVPGFAAREVRRVG